MEKPHKPSEWRPQAGEEVIIWWQEPDCPPGFNDIKRIPPGTKLKVIETNFKTILVDEGQYLDVERYENDHCNYYHCPLWRNVFPAQAISQSGPCACPSRDLFWNGHSQQCSLYNG